MQDSLFPDPTALRSRVLLRARDFDALFEGFFRLRCVSYVVSPELLLEFFDRGYQEVELVLGDNLSDAYRRHLAHKGAEVTRRLAERMAAGSLRVYIPDRTLHTKLYLLERPGQRRVIATSANLTTSARWAGRQVNYAWYADLPPGHPWLAQAEEDYATHRARCAPFMGDLAELIRDSREEQRQGLVEAWLKGVPAEEVRLETRRLLEEISRRSLGAAAETVFSVRLPESPAARSEAQRLLSRLHPAAAGSELRLDGRDYLRYVQEAHGVPLLRADPERRELRLGLDGEVRVLSEDLPEPGRADAALAGLEDYFATVDSGQAPDPRFAKASMFEALLHLFSAPFADQYMRLKRRRYGAIDSRGPRFLYIYGSSQNGKSTFLRFALKLIAGRRVEPLGGGDFAKRKLLGAAAAGTCFPLVFDDLVLTQRPGLFEEVLKSYWEVWWSEEGVSPQIVLSSNACSLKEWARSRVKRLDFDVHFAPGAQGKEALARVFRAENPVFRWFSRLCFQELERPEPLPEDELEPARRAFEALYRRAGRSLPDYFPREPIERTYDSGRWAWRELLDRLRKARVDWERDRASVHFAEDMQLYEIREYESCLPPQIKLRRRGKALIIESPKEFRTWLEGGPRRQSWWSRIKRLAA